MHGEKAGDHAESFKYDTILYTCVLYKQINKILKCR